MSTISIVVQNNSTVVSAKSLAASFPIFEHQANVVFHPYWDQKPQVQLFDTAANAPAPVWNAYIYDDLYHVPSSLVRVEALSGAVGWHDLDGGTPYLIVLASTANSSSLAAYSWTWVFSHEMLEMLANPKLQYVGPYTGNGNAVAFGAEVCDPVQGTGYRFKGQILSNFVTPAWFEPQANGRLDYLETLKEPLVAGSGGTNNLLVLYN